MFFYRVISALVGIPIAVFLIWYGGLPLSAAIFVLAVLGIFEMNVLWKKVGVHIWLVGALTGGFLFVINAYLNNNHMMGAVLFILLAAGFVHLVRMYPRFNMTELAATIFSTLYAGWLLAYIIILRQLPGGFHLVLLVLVSTWSSDTFAYITGSAIGKRKLAPVLSPNKSVEGSVGGIVGSMAAAASIGAVGQQFPMIHYLAVGLLAGCMGQVGDLVESALKRLAGVKDSGSVIPGHGGILDRFDSLLITAPVVYYYLKLVIFP